MTDEDCRKHGRLLAIKDRLILMLKEVNVVLSDKYLALFYSRDLCFNRNVKISSALNVAKKIMEIG